MKKTILKVLVLCLAVALFSASNFSAAPVKEIETNDIKQQEIDLTKIYEARFLNMLEHNFVYNEDIKYIDKIVNNSILALLDLREGDYISECLVKDFVYNMYGVEIEDFSQINNEFEKQEGYVYIIPRGYSEFEHKIIAVDCNEDGSITVTTEICENTHYDEVVVSTCKTLFVKNDNSVFGFNIINSVIE